MRRKFMCMMLSLCAVFLSACSGDTASAEIAVTAQTTTLSSEKLSETETETEASAVSAETSQTESTTPAETSETVTETTSVESETSVTSTETTADETASESEIITTTEAPQTETETETTTASKPPAEIIIPEIKTPLASGKDTAKSETAEIDFTHADDGYISAVYTGKSSRAKLRVKCGDLQYDHDLSADGTREFFPLMKSGEYSVKVYEQVSGKSYAESASAEFRADISDTVGMYLYPNKYSSFDSSSESVKKAAEVCAGIDEDIEKIAAIFGYVSGNITYDKELAATVQSGYVPAPDRTLSKGKGICFDYASLMAAMCRSQGIPARLVIGYADPDIYHAWNEIYTDETGWITPELFLKNKGYNIADATFYAGNTNKEKIAEYIADDSNYAAMYIY